MSGRLYEVGWVRNRFKSLYSDQPALSPIIEHPIQTPGGEVLTRERDRDISLLPDLIIERVPRHRDDDEPEEFYIKLERKMRKYYKKLFGLPRKDGSSTTEFNEEIYGYNPCDLNSEEDFNRAFIDDLRSSTKTNRDEDSKAGNSSSYEDIDDEIQCYDSNIRDSKVVASTKIADEDETVDDQDEKDQEEDVDADSAHSLILCTKTNRDEDSKAENSSSYEDLDDEIQCYDSNIRDSRVAASTKIADEDETVDDQDEKDQEEEDADAESAHSLILSSNVTRRYRYDRRDSTNADTLKNLRVDEDWSVSTFQLEAGRIRESSEEMQQDDGADDGDEVREENMIDNNKTIEEDEEYEENSEDYETIEIEEVMMRRKNITPQRSSSFIENMIDNNKTIEEDEENEGNSEDYETIEIEDVDLMRRKENTPQRSSIRLASGGTVSPVTPTFTRQSLDLSKPSIERASEEVFDATPHFKHSFAPKTSTPRKRRSGKISGDDDNIRPESEIDVRPAKMKCIGIQTCRDYLVDVETQTEMVECKNVQVQVSLKLRRVMPEKAAAR